MTNSSHRGWPLQFTLIKTLLPPHPCFLTTLSSSIFTLIPYFPLTCVLQLPLRLSRTICIWFFSLQCCTSNGRRICGLVIPILLFSSIRYFTRSIFFILSSFFFFRLPFLKKNITHHRMRINFKTTIQWFLLILYKPRWIRSFILRRDWLNSASSFSMEIYSKPLTTGRLIRSGQVM